MIKKIIIFIDDLDRCSPKETVQVLESTKAFLDIRGFVFVIGLSLETTDK
jgi:predicted KAP-like P-loop ATPase